LYLISFFPLISLSFAPALSLDAPSPPPPPHSSPTRRSSDLLLSDLLLLNRGLARGFNARLRDASFLRRRFQFDRRFHRHFTEYRSEEHTSELQSHLNLVCRLLLEKKKQKT